MLNAGFNNFVNEDRILAFADYRKRTAPITRAIHEAEDVGKVIDFTCGHKTNTVIFLDTGHIVLSFKLPETIDNNLRKKVVHKDA